MQHLKIGHEKKKGGLIIMQALKINWTRAVNYFVCLEFDAEQP
jgi:hypothetical protein